MVGDPADHIATRRSLLQGSMGDFAGSALKDILSQRSQGTQSCPQCLKCPKCLRCLKCLKTTRRASRHIGVSSKIFSHRDHREHRGVLNCSFLC